MGVCSLERNFVLEDLGKLVSLCKRRGFIFPSSEIYGGFASVWDYGPLGVLLKQNVKKAWFRHIVQLRDDVVPLDSAILASRRVWEASGHLAHFADLMVDCKKCKQRFRADEVEGGRCPDCGGELTEPRSFVTMFKTFVGPVEEEAAVAYLRPETAQGIFVNFRNVLLTTRMKPPFGIAQIGKAFRNEITTGNFIFRVREFEQMELEYFVMPGTAAQWYDYWVKERHNWWLRLGLRPERVRLHFKKPEELAHYARAAVDIEYHFPFGWGELEGIADRGDYDLRQHAHYSGEELTFFDEDSRKHVVPEVVEPSAGVDRAVLAFLADAYDEEVDEKGETRVVLHLHPALAPIKIAVFPLLKRPESLASMARDIYSRLKQRYHVVYDESGTIGRRYRRQDEVGTPYGVTIDHQSLEDGTVTIRDRDSMQQVRVPADRLTEWFADKFEA